MPELPEVETTRRSLLEWALHRPIQNVVVRAPKLRFDVPKDLHPALIGQTLSGITRRGKYLIVHVGERHLLIHLGMSGSLRRQNTSTPPKKHDHVDIVFDNGDIIRYHDPRRFGLIVWTPPDWTQHPLLKNLGVEPLSETFSGKLLYALTRGRNVPIKTFLMNAKQLVGVGNIYAAEALFRAGIHPNRKAGSLSLSRANALAQAIQETLREALASGGSTLRDYVHGNGDPGAFQLELRVYGREGEPCTRCGHAIRLIRQSNRSSFYCPKCQR